MQLPTSFIVEKSTSQISLPVFQHAQSLVPPELTHL
jgi:hypothetical protein